MLPMLTSKDVTMVTPRDLASSNLKPKKDSTTLSLPLELNLWVDKFGLLRPDQNLKESRNTDQREITTTVDMVVTVVMMMNMMMDMDTTTEEAEEEAVEEAEVEAVEEAEVEVVDMDTADTEATTTEEVEEEAAEEAEVVQDTKELNNPRLFSLVT